MTLFVVLSSGSERKFWQKLYTYLPPIILLYLLPSLLNSFQLVNGAEAKVGKFALNTLLPLSLLMLTMTIDFKSLLSLSKKAIIVFLAGTVGIVIGGPIALWLVGQFSPDLLADHGANSIWRGLVTITGSWINGTPGQTSMKEIFGSSDELFFMIIAVDALAQNIWIALLFFGAKNTNIIDKWLKADTKELDKIYQLTHRDDVLEEKITHDLSMTGKIKYYTQPRKLKMIFVLFLLCMITLAAINSVTTYLTDYFTGNFNIDESSNWTFITKRAFWLVFFSTSIGIILSFTKVRELDEAGATRIGNFLLYLIISTIGLKMDIFQLNGQWELLALCGIWLIIHMMIVLIVARMVRAPFFFVAVGSQANIGGPATASMVASAFNPHLASMGVILGVLSNIIGNYFALISGILFKWIVG